MALDELNSDLVLYCRFYKWGCWIAITCWPIRNHIYGDGNQWRDSTCELPDKSFKDMSGMAAELFCLGQSAILSPEACFDCLTFLPNTYMIVWITGMLFYFGRSAQKLWNRVIKIEDLTQASLFVMLGPLEVVTFS